MRKSLICCIICLIACGQSTAQTVYGVVIDSISRIPIPGVTVFVNNSSYGTTTDPDGHFRLPVRVGKSEVVVSMLSYKSQSVSVLLAQSDSLVYNVNLSPKPTLLDAITVKGAKDRSWQRDLVEFKKTFLGDVDNKDCNIANPWYINLRREKKSGEQILVADASRAIEIDNHILGYKVFYQLLDFRSTKTQVRVYGNVIYQQLTANSAAESAKWDRNRKQAYAGSLRHLWKSILDNNAESQGFSLFIVRLARGGVVQHVTINPVGRSLDPAHGIYSININKRVFVSFKDGNGRERTTTLDFADDHIDVNSNGVMLDPLAVTVTGDMSKARLAQFLPEDYEPPQNSTMTNPSPHRPTIDSLTDAIRTNLQNKGEEEIYLHLDRSFYFIGEDCWFKAYVADKSTLIASPSSLLYVDLIDPTGSIVGHKRLKVDQGRASGDLEISNNQIAGNYTVRAYMPSTGTEQRVSYTREISVLSPNRNATVPLKSISKSTIDLQFFPEGGTLLPGIITQMAFKAIDSHGLGIDVKGKIVDDHNKVIIDFKSTHLGMGVFPFIADANHTFRAILENGDVFDLPNPTLNGLSLNASGLNGKDIRVKIEITDSIASPLFLIAHTRGRVNFAQTIVMAGRSFFTSIPRDVIGEGVLRVTLFDATGKARCERLIFVKGGPTMNLSVETSQVRFDKRDSVDIILGVSDKNGNPVQTPLSVSVIDASFAPLQQNAETLYTRLLLQSEIKGQVERPSWYFEQATNERSVALDLLMRTQGWTAYNWDRLHAEKDTVAHHLEGITLSGTVFARDKPLVNSPFVLSIPILNKKVAAFYQTDSLGRFSIPGLDFYDSAIVSWRVMNKRGVMSNVRVELNPDPIPQVDQKMIRETNTGYTIETNMARFLRNGVWAAEPYTELAEVTVEASKITPSAGGGFLVKPAKEDMNSTTFQFVSRYALKLPMIMPTLLPDGTEVYNGVVLTVNDFLRNDDNPMLVLNSIPIEMIENVFVKGSPRQGYFIAVKTRNSPVESSFGSVELLVKGYDAVREFYHPKYKSLPSENTNDNRITLSWEPNLKTDSNGNAVCRFYNNDLSTRFLVTIEGLVDGQIISHSQVIGTEP